MKIRFATNSGHETTFEVDPQSDLSTLFAKFEGYHFFFDGYRLPQQGVTPASLGMNPKKVNYIDLIKV